MLGGEQPNADPRPTDLFGEQGTDPAFDAAWIARFLFDLILGASGLDHKGLVISPRKKPM